MNVAKNLVTANEATVLASDYMVSMEQLQAWDWDAIRLAVTHAPAKVQKVSKTLSESVREHDLGAVPAGMGPIDAVLMAFCNVAKLNGLTAAPYVTSQGDTVLAVRSVATIGDVTERTRRIRQNAFAAFESEIFWKGLPEFLRHAAAKDGPKVDPEHGKCLRFDTFTTSATLLSPSGLLGSELEHTRTADQVEGDAVFLEAWDEFCAMKGLHGYIQQNEDRALLMVAWICVLPE